MRAVVGVNCLGPEKYLMANHKPYTVYREAAMYILDKIQSKNQSISFNGGVLSVLLPRADKVGFPVAVARGIEGGSSACDRCGCCCCVVLLLCGGCCLSAPQAGDVGETAPGLLLDSVPSISCGHPIASDAITSDSIASDAILIILPPLNHLDIKYLY